MATELKAHTLSIAEAAALIARRELSPVELTRAVLDRIQEVDDHTKAFVTVLSDSALEAARAAERAIAAGQYRGPLHGIPIGLKDICDTKGIVTTSGSRIRANYIPTRDAAVTERLLKAGAIIVGKTVTHDFARGVVSPPTRNPWDLDRIPGGSSGGSGAAVAADECLGAIGTDTGGSIRIPAALNGIVGLKPTFGRVSKWGITILSWSLDHAGPLTKRVEDAALMLGAIAGYDRRDPTTVPEPVPDYTAELRAGVRGLTLGVPRNYFFDRLDPDVDRAVRAAIDVLRGEGATIAEVTIPSVEYTLAAYVPISISEASTYHQQMLRRHADDYADDVRLRTEAGELVLATHYLKAQRTRTVIKRGFRTAFAGVDALLAPMLPAPAPRADALTVELDGQAVPVMVAYPTWSAPTNLAGLPSLTVPCGFSRDNLPLALQIIGRPFDEATVLRVGQAYEAATKWHERKPPL